MPTQPIPIGNFQESGKDRLGGGSPIAMNVWADDRGTVYRRPAISVSENVTSDQIDENGVDAIHATPTGTCYAVGGLDPTYMTVAGIRKIYRMTAGGAVSLSNTDLESLLGRRRPVVCETEAMMVFAAANVPQKVLLSTHVSSRLGGGPPRASYIIMNSSRLLGNDTAVDQTAVRFSEPDIGTSYAGHEIWGYGGFGSSGYFLAEAQPDPVVAIAENSNEVMVWGTNTLEINVPDETWVYSQLLTSPHGCAAPYSIINAEGNFAWLNQYRQFVISNGREFQIMSGDIQSDLDRMEKVSDCFGYRLVLGGLEALIWTFPTDGRTFVYQKGLGWGQWSGWDDNTANWKRLIVNCHHMRRDTGENLVGTSTGYVGKFDLDARTDLDETVRSYVQTGYLNRGTEARKWCKNVTMSVRRGQTTSSVAPIVRLSFSDDPGIWSVPMEINLGVGGDMPSVIPLGNMGTYRRRAWRFDFSDADYLALAALEEEYEVL
jgi:hypothetical protein